MFKQAVMNILIDDVGLSEPTANVLADKIIRALVYILRGGNDDG